MKSVLLKKNSISSRKRATDIEAEAPTAVQRERKTDLGGPIMELVADVADAR